LGSRPIGPARTAHMVFVCDEIVVAVIVAGGDRQRGGN
jgi:hypothetical protein